MLSKAKYDSSPARPIHRSRQGCRRIPATHSPHPLRQGNQVSLPHPLLPICVLTETSRQGKSPQAGMHTEQGRKITSPLQHAAMTNARHCKAQRSALRRPMQRTTFFPHRCLSPRAALCTLHFSLFTSRRDVFHFPKGQPCHATPHPITYRASSHRHRDSNAPGCAGYRSPGQPSRRHLSGTCPLRGPSRAHEGRCAGGCHRSHQAVRP